MQKVTTRFTAIENESHSCTNACSMFDANDVDHAQITQMLAALPTTVAFRGGLSHHQSHTMHCSTGDAYKTTTTSFQMLGDHITNTELSNSDVISMRDCSMSRAAMEPTRYAGRHVRNHGVWPASKRRCQ